MSTFSSGAATEPPSTDVENSQRASAFAFRGAAVGMTGACLCLWWLRVWWIQGDRIDRYINFDALMYWTPLLRQAAAQWRQGMVPLWNPYQAFGTPLLATLQVGAAYPLNAPYLLLGVGWAWLLTSMVHHAIAICGMYVFCRAVDLSKPAALVGGLTFGFSGLVIAKYVDQPEFICLAWLPALFAGAECLLMAPSFTATAALAGLWTLQILGGHPETIAQSALLLAAYVAVRLSGIAVSAPRHALAAAGASLTAAVLALALSAFQWLPTLELLRHSVRAVGELTFTQQSILSVEPWRLATGPAGRMPLALGLIGLCTWRRRGLAWFFGSAAVVLALLSTGTATPMFALFRHLPTGTWFRAPVRFLNLWPLCVAVLIAAAVDGLALAAAPRSRRRRLRILAGGALVLTALRIGLADRNDWMRLLLVVGVFDWLPVLAASAAISTHVAQPASIRVWHFRSILVLAAICAAPGFYLQHYVSPLQVDGIYGQYGNLFRDLQHQSPARVLSLLPFAGAPSWAKLGTYFEVPVLNDLEPLSLQDFRTFSDLLRGDGAGDLSALLTTFMGETAPPRERFDPRMLNLSGVGFVLTDTTAETAVMPWFSPGIQLIPWRKSGNAALYENRAALPRAFFLGNDKVRQAAPQCVDSLRTPEFDPQAVLVLEQAPAMAPAKTTGGTDRVDVLEYLPSRVRLRVTSTRAGFVMLTDAYYPGWTAAVDGSEAPVLRADCFFRAVPVPAGAHEVLFRYASLPFRIGSAISLSSLGLIVILGFARWHSNPH